MVCPRCGAEHEVEVNRIRRGRRADGRVSANFDTRQVRCLSCGFIWFEESRIAYCSVYDPVVMKEKKVSVEEYVQNWRGRDEIHPAKMRLFNE